MISVEKRTRATVFGGEVVASTARTGALLSNLVMLKMRMFAETFKILSSNYIQN